MSLKKFIFVLLLFSMLSISTTAQKRNVKRPAPSSIATSRYLTFPFDSKLEILPKHFLGHDARRIFAGLLPLAVAANQQCGRYEKRDECQMRLNSLYERSISAGLTASDTLAFSFAVDCDYNADSEVATCPDFSIQNLAVTGSSMWSHELVKTGSYVGQNAFGARKRIEYRKYRNLHIEARPHENERFKLEKLSPDVARVILPNLRTLIVGDPLTPFAKSEPVSYPPKFDDPVEIDGDNYTIVLNRWSVWLYDFETGKVWARSN